MAKATSGSVVLELTANEARALHALTGGTCAKGSFVDELAEVFEALESCGASSVDYEVRWNESENAVYIGKE